MNAERLKLAASNNVNLIQGGTGHRRWEQDGLVACLFADLRFR
jgi:hypothetical protein